MRFRFDCTVPASEWSLSDYMYRLALPIHPFHVNPGVRSVTGTIHENRVVTITYVEKDCEVRYHIEVPEDAIIEDVYEDPSTKSFSTSHILICKHTLRNRWWACVLNLCKAARFGDMPGWSAAWKAMVSVAIDESQRSALGDTIVLITRCNLPANLSDIIIEKLVCLQPGWMKAGAEMVLCFLHHALAASGNESCIMLEQLLKFGGLHASSLSSMYKGFLVIANKKPDDDWVDVQGAGCIHRRIVDHFGLKFLLPGGSHNVLKSSVDILQQTKHTAYKDNPRYVVGPPS